MSAAEKRTYFGDDTSAPPAFDNDALKEDKMEFNRAKASLTSPATAHAYLDQRAKDLKISEVRDYKEHVSYALFDKKTIDSIVDFFRAHNVNEALEVFAGRGLLSYFLSKFEFTVTATDDKSTYGTEDGAAFHEVVNMDAVKAARQSKADALIMCWAPLGSEAPNKALKAFRGPCFVHIGERRGATANSDFFDTLERDWVLVGVHLNPQFHDQRGATEFYVRGVDRAIGVSYDDSYDDRLSVVEYSNVDDIEPGIVIVRPSDTLVVTYTDDLVVIGEGDNAAKESVGAIKEYTYEDLQIIADNQVYDRATA